MRRIARWLSKVYQPAFSILDFVLILVACFAFCRALWRQEELYALLWALVALLHYRCIVLGSVPPFPRRRLMVREYDVCQNGQHKKMLIYASEPYDPKEDA